MTIATPTRHKKQANVTLTPGTYEKLEEWAKKEKYGTKSAVVEDALVKLFYDAHPSPAQNEMESYLRSPEGKAVIKSIIRESLSLGEEDQTIPISNGR